MNIVHLSECDKDYVTAAKSVNSLSDLKRLVKDYREIAEDAYAVVRKMKEPEFKEFCNQRNKKIPSMKWMEKYGAVLLPKMILIVGMYATQYHVPFGAMYLRLKDLGKLEEVMKDGNLV